MTNRPKHLSYRACIQAGSLLDVERLLRQGFFRDAWNRALYLLAHSFRGPEQW